MDWINAELITQVFFIFACLSLIGSGLMVILFQDSVRSALSLILAFFSAACLWLLFEAEFLAILLLLVYVGAVMVLFLFVIMMVHQGKIHLSVSPKTSLVSWVVGLAMFAQIALLLFTKIQTIETAQTSDIANPQLSHTYELGLELFTNHLYAFEVAGVMLLLAIVIAIVLTQRPSRTPKVQNPTHQLQVKAKDRLRFAQFKPSTPDQS